MDNKKLEEIGDMSNCPVRNVIDRIGDKWSFLVMLHLDERKVLRFNEMHKNIDNISQKMLAVTLKTLEADGLVSRKVFPVIPPKVEYTLTARGQSLMPHLHGLVDWAKNQMDDILVSREEYAINN